ncbi:MAG: T9SS type A sorting domain-containing protein [Crocinitomicaceae bacterium]|nr:T9SS type A sorting domain-containing protein [Crocinitomicaceae bacterium]
MNIVTSEELDIQMTNVLGEIILSQKLHPGTTSIDVRGLSSGIYLIQSNKGKSVKFIRE